MTNAKAGAGRAEVVVDLDAIARAQRLIVAAVRDRDLDAAHAALEGLRGIRIPQD